MVDGKVDQIDSHREEDHAPTWPGGWRERRRRRRRRRREWWWKEKVGRRMAVRATDRCGEAGRGWVGGWMGGEELAQLDEGGKGQDDQERHADLSRARDTYVRVCKSKQRSLPK